MKSYQKFCEDLAKNICEYIFKKKLFKPKKGEHTDWEDREKNPIVECKSLKIENYCDYYSSRLLIKDFQIYNPLIFKGLFDIIEGDKFFLLDYQLIKVKKYIKANTMCYFIEGNVLDHMKINVGLFSNMEGYKIIPRNNIMMWAKKILEKEK